MLPATRGLEKEKNCLGWERSEMDIESPSVDVASNTRMEEERDTRVCLEWQDKYKKKRFLVGERDREPHNV